jgi:hypothetical protein
MSSNGPLRRHYSPLQLRYFARNGIVAVIGFLVLSSYDRSIDDVSALIPNIFHSWRKYHRPISTNNMDLNMVQCNTSNLTHHNTTTNPDDTIVPGNQSAHIGTGDRLSPPYNTNDRPERGKLLPHTPNASELYDAYKSIQSEYQTKAFQDTNQWRVLNTDDDVVVSILHHPTDPTCPYVKMEGTIPVPVQQCWNFLGVERWDKNMPKMDPFYEGVTIYGEYNLSMPVISQHQKRMPGSNLFYGTKNDDETITESSQKLQRHPLTGSPTASKNNRIRMILCRKRMSRIITFGKRDLVFLSCTESVPLPDGTLVSGTVSVQTPRIPRIPGYTRAFQDSIAFYKPIRNNTETYVVLSHDIIIFYVVVIHCSLLKSWLVSILFSLDRELSWKSAR